MRLFATGGAGSRRSDVADPGDRKQSATQERTEVWWLVLLMVVGFFAGVVSHYVQGVYRGQPYPHNTFLFVPPVAFSDLSATLTLSGDASPYLAPSISFASNYPPFAHLLLRPLSGLPFGMVLAIFLVGVTGAVVWLVAVLVRLSSPSTPPGPRRSGCSTAAA